MLLFFTVSIVTGSSSRHILEVISILVVGWRETCF